MEELRETMKLFSSAVKWMDRGIGRGSYKWLRKYVDPNREYTQLTYGRLISEIVAPRTRWLDAGCGHQVYDARRASDEIELVGRAKVAVGCDLVSSSLTRHRSIRNLTSCSLTQLPFADNTFDLVTLNMVAEHLEHPEAVFAEIARVLDWNGALVVHTPNAEGYVVKLIRMGRRFIPESMIFQMIKFLEYREPQDVFPTFYRANTMLGLRQTLSNTGLTEDKALLLNDKPLLYFAFPFSFLELALTRILYRFGWQRRTAMVILDVHRKVPAAATCADGSVLISSPLGPLGVASLGEKDRANGVGSPKNEIVRSL